MSMWRGSNELVHKSKRGVLLIIHHHAFLLITKNALDECHVKPKAMASYILLGGRQTIVLFVNFKLR